MTQKQIGDKILERFIELKATTGYQLDYDWVKNHFKRKLKFTEMHLISEAVDQLFEKAYISFENNEEPMLVLTRQGFESIYKAEEDKSIKLLCREIMNRFKQQHLSPNQLVIFSWLEQSIAHDFNPREMEWLGAAVDNLINKGYIERDEKHKSSLLLTYKGHDFINNIYSLKEAG